MQIEIKQDIFYDTEKPYTEQEADVQAAISELINKQPDQKTEEPAGHISIPLWYDWGHGRDSAYGRRVLDFNSTMVRLGVYRNYENTK
jgi:hypothetical protein